MAKKQQTGDGAAAPDAAAEPKKGPPSAAPEKPDAAAEPKKGKERKPREPGEKTSPAAEATPKPAAVAAPAVAPAEGPKKKKKPGKSPSRGKKLRNQSKNLRQRIAKESPAPAKPLPC